MVLSFPSELEIARELAQGISMYMILREECSPELLGTVDSLILKSRDENDLSFGYLLPPRIAAGFPDGNSVWKSVQEFCRKRLGDDCICPAHLLELLIVLYGDEQTLVALGKSIVSKLEPSLEFDEDGLLVGPESHLRFTKEGVLTRDHWIFFSRHFRGQEHLDGFLDDLLRTRGKVGSDRFSLALESDALLKRSLHAVVGTRAFIRGPKGISKEQLLSPRFPEDSSGTVTVHARVGEEPLHQLFPLVRSEIMWSARGQYKSVQIEELVAPTNYRSKEWGRLMNRYVHAQWSPAEEAFTHFDGAIRFYRLDEYQARLDTDLKKFGGKASGYRKLFRLDTRLRVDDWCRLVMKFFSENELILEYLGGPQVAEV